MRTFTRNWKGLTKLTPRLSVFSLSALAWGSLAAMAMLFVSCQGPKSSTDVSSETDQADVSSETDQAEQAITRTADPYINRLLPEAKRIRKKYGIPLDLTLAIAAHETGYGKYVIGQNNHFGLKCRTKDCVTLTGRRGSKQWENCSDPAPCFDIFAKSIQDLSDGEFKNLKKIRRQGYAVSPQWTRKVRKIRRTVRRQLKQAQKTS